MAKLNPIRELEQKVDNWDREKRTKICMKELKRARKSGSQGMVVIAIQNIDATL